MPTRVLRLAAIATAPIGLAALAAVHPIVIDRLIPGDQLAVWTLIHTLQLPLAALLGIAVLLLIEGLDGVEARAARLAVVPWAVAFAAFDGIAGLAAGSLSTYGYQHAADVDTVTAIAVAVADSVMVSAVLPLTAFAFAFPVFGGAALALHRAGASGFAAFAIGASGITWTFIHPLVGAPAMALFLIGVVLVERSRAARPTASRVVGHVAA
jgi:hypothetical protein